MLYNNRLIPVKHHYINMDDHSYNYVMKTTLDLSDELYRQVKKRADDDDTSIKGIVEKALRLYLGGKIQGEYRFTWHPDRGTLLPGIDLDDRDSLFNAMERS